jgi:hypothetical protein
MTAFKKFLPVASAFVDVRPRDRRSVKRAIRALALNHKSYGLDSSYGEEFTHLRTLLDRIEPVSRSCVDIAAGNGVTQSCTTPLFREGWSGLAVELDGDKFATLAFILQDTESVRLSRQHVRPENIQSLLEASDVAPEF